MTMILASLPKQSQDSAKAYIQQTMRNNVSGEFGNCWIFHFRVLIFIEFGIFEKKIIEIF